MDELLLKLTSVDAKGNYINATSVFLCESFCRAVVFLNTVMFLQHLLKGVSVIPLISVSQSKTESENSKNTNTVSLNTCLEQ